MKKIIFSIILIGILILIGYTQIFRNKFAKLPTNGSTTVEQGVYGVVRGTPYRGMPGIVEPDMPSQPITEVGPTLSDVTIQIREYFAKDKEVGKIIATTSTDGDGFYKAALPEGTYFLAVVNAEVEYALTVEVKGMGDDDKVNTFEIISVTSDSWLEQNIVVPQFWPE